MGTTKVMTNPNILAGKPTIEDTRVSVGLILKKLAQNIDITEILKDFPRLTREDMQSAFLYAENLIVRQS